MELLARPTIHDSRRFDSLAKVYLVRTSRSRPRGFLSSPWYRTYNESAKSQIGQLLTGGPASLQLPSAQMTMTQSIYVCTLLISLQKLGRGANGQDNPASALSIAEKTAQWQNLHPTAFVARGVPASYWAITDQTSAFELKYW